jgi:uracil-DNA glycosylase family protein
MNLSQLRERVAECRACELYRDAMRAVPGEGSTRARAMLIGEQPGDREDVEGKPFVGPAGRLLDRALEQAGIERQDVYVTNVVKHFRFRARGKRRIHQAPGREHIEACRPWLDAELEAVKPRVLVLMGATAAKALLGSTVRVTIDRGQPLESELAECVFVTVHPSSILRAPDENARREQFDAFVADLKRVADALA